ncbi:MAG: hypothetical protein HOA17_05550 [Candidatus Melainabacteria bacterium]|jgi:hypothetical protein|nr:hypothetical protein [Candidatus Melainabacteria bacterium]
MIDKNHNNPLSSQVAPISEEAEMKDFLMGLKLKLNNSETEEARNQRPRFAQSKKSVSNKVIFELDETGIKEITKT